MSDSNLPHTVGPGELAPEFDLPLVASDGRVTLDDFCGRAPLFLVLLRSFECPFCRRQLAALKITAQGLVEHGIETLAVTTTPAKEAALYAKYRPPGLPLASDPSLGIHRAYGVPIYRFAPEQPTAWPATINPADLSTLVLKPTDDLSEPLPVIEAGKRLDEMDGFELIETDEQGPPDDLSPLVSYFLIDSTGRVQWVHVVARDDFSDYARHPSNQELLEAARQIALQCRQTPGRRRGSPLSASG